MTIFDEITERRILAGMMTEPAVFALCDDIETQDFTDFRHWVVLGAIRQLASEGADVGPVEVDDLLRQRDRSGSGAVAESCGIWFLAALVINMEPYRGERVLIEHDAWWLKALTRRRLALEAAS